MIKLFALLFFAILAETDFGGQPSGETPPVASVKVFNAPKAPTNQEPEIVIGLATPIEVPDLRGKLDLRARAEVAQIYPTLVTNTTTFRNPNEALRKCDCAYCRARKEVERTELGLITYAVIGQKRIALEGSLLWATNRLYRLNVGTNDVSTNRVYAVE